MPSVMLNHHPCVYEIEGDGFPLFLVAGPDNAIFLWRPLMPLLGELCKVIAYDYGSQRTSKQTSERFRSDRLAQDLLTLMDMLAVDRAYLAASAPAIPMVTEVLQQAAARLEGLILIGDAEEDTLTSSTAWQMAAMPTLLLVGEQDLDHCRWAAQQAVQWPHVSQRQVPGAGQMPLHEQPRRLGHVMMPFLSHCERQRNLVRGASFLL